MRGASISLSAVFVVGLLAGCGDRGSGASGRSSSNHRSAAAAATRHARVALGLTRWPPRAYRDVCHRQAAMAPAGARRCPPLIPIGPLQVAYRGKSLGRDGPQGGFSADLASRSLNRVDGRPVATNGGHWRYDVVWTPRMRRAVVQLAIRRPVNAQAASSCRSTRVAGRRMLVCRVLAYEAGGGVNGGHIAYVWDDGPITYVISVHGYPNDRRARAMMAALVAAVDA